MAWITAAGALGGAAIGAFGGSDKPKAAPYKEAQAAFLTNNPDIRNPFGTQSVSVNDQGTKGREDDTYSLQQSLSPEMQALADMLLAKAGASRGSFSSGGMPQGFADEFKKRTGYGPAVASYDRPEFGFGAGDGPAQVDPELAAEYESAISLPEGATNQEALDFMRANGYLEVGGFDAKDADWLQEHFNTGAGDQNWQNWNDGFYLNGGLNEKNQGRVAEFMGIWDSLDTSTPQASTPPPGNFDPAALDSLVGALTTKRY